MIKKSDGTHVTLGDMPEIPAQHSVDLPTLSMDEMKALEAQAREEINAELKARLKADFLAKTKADLKKKAFFVEGKDAKGAQIERIYLNLPKFNDRITLDGVIYFHGCTYNFTPGAAAVINETMHRAWLHHAEINGLDMNEYAGRKPLNQVVQPHQ